MTLRSLPAIVWTLVIVGVCLVPSSWLGSVGPSDGPSWLDRLLGPLLGILPYDKLIHFGIFLVFGLLWQWAGASVRATLIGGLLLAVGTELGQSIPALERSTDLEDLIANVTGILVAIGAFRLWRGRGRGRGRGPSPSPFPES